jgi:hypothetical protein
MKKFLILATLLLLHFAAAACTGRISVRHDVTYTNKGTRSEAQHGHLFINEIRVPDYYSRVLADGKSFIFLQRQHRWGDDGYFQEEEAKNPGRSETPVSNEQKEQGWYTGTLRLAKTPCSWLYLEWEGGSAFAAPEALSRLAEAEKLPLLLREKALELD